MQSSSISASTLPSSSPKVPRVFGMKLVGKNSLLGLEKIWNMVWHETKKTIPVDYVITPTTEVTSMITGGMIKTFILQGFSESMLTSFDESFLRSLNEDARKKLTILISSQELQVQRIKVWQDYFNTKIKSMVPLLTASSQYVYAAKYLDADPRTGVGSHLVFLYGAVQDIPKDFNHQFAAVPYAQLIQIGKIKTITLKGFQEQELAVFEKELSIFSDEIRRKLVIIIDSPRMSWPRIRHWQTLYSCSVSQNIIFSELKPHLLKLWQYYYPSDQKGVTTINNLTGICWGFSKLSAADIKVLHNRTIDLLFSNLLPPLGTPTYQMFMEPFFKLLKGQIQTYTKLVPFGVGVYNYQGLLNMPFLAEDSPVIVESQIDMGSKRIAHAVKLESTKIHDQEYIIINDKNLEHWQYTGIKGSTICEKIVKQVTLGLTNLPCLLEFHCHNSRYYDEKIEIKFVEENCLWDAPEFKNNQLLQSLFEKLFHSPNLRALYLRKKPPTLEILGNVLILGCEGKHTYAMAQYLCYFSGADDAIKELKLTKNQIELLANLRDSAGKSIKDYISDPTLFKDVSPSRIQAILAYIKKSVVSTISPSLSVVFAGGSAGQKSKLSPPAPSSFRNESLA